MALTARRYPQPLPVRVPEGLRTSLKRLAEKEHLDVSELVRTLLAEGIALRDLESSMEVHPTK